MTKTITPMMEVRHKIEGAVAKSLKDLEHAEIANYDIAVALVARNLGITREPEIDGHQSGVNPGPIIHTCGTDDGTAYRITAREGFLSLSTWNHNGDHEDDSDCEYYEDDTENLTQCRDYHCSSTAHVDNQDQLEHIYQLAKFAAGK